MKIAVVGTGYVGLVVGACLAETGNDVICVDKDDAKVRMLRKGRVPIYEPGLTELVKRERRRGTADVHDPAGQGGQGLADCLHRRRHAAGRGRVRRPAARAGRRPRHRPGDGRLPGHRQQEHGPGRHGREACARIIAQRDHASLQRRQQPRVPEAGRGRRRLHEARSGRDRRRGSARRRADGGALPAVHAHRRADHGDGLRQRRAVRSTRRTRCSRRASRS